MVVTSKEICQRLAAGLISLEPGTVKPDKTSSVRVDDFLTSDAYVNASMSELYQTFLGRRCTVDDLKVHAPGYVAHGWANRLEVVTYSDECWHTLGGGHARLFFRNLWLLISGQSYLPDIDAIVSSLEGGASRPSLIRPLLERPASCVYLADHLWTRLTGIRGACPLACAFTQNAKEDLIKQIVDHDLFIASMSVTPALKSGMESGLEIAAYQLREECYQAVGEVAPRNGVAADVKTLLDPASTDGVWSWLLSFSSRKRVLTLIKTALVAESISVDGAVDSDFGYYAMRFGAPSANVAQRAESDCSAATAEQIVRCFAKVLRVEIDGSEVSDLASHFIDHNSVTALVGRILHLKTRADFLGSAVVKSNLSCGPAAGPFISTGHVVEKEQNFASRPTIATTYFCWYDIVNGRGFLENPDRVNGLSGTLSLTSQPATLEGFSYYNLSLHEREMLDMVDAGIDVMLPVYFGSPFSSPKIEKSDKEEVFGSPSNFSDISVRKIVLARDHLLSENKTPPYIGMFHDTSGVFDNVINWHVDCSCKIGWVWLYETWRNFFSQVPRRHWATIEGRPIIFVYHPSFIRHAAVGFYDYARKRFLSDFGVEPHIVSAAEQDAVQINHAAALDDGVQELSRGGSLALLSRLLSSEEAWHLAGANAQSYSEFVCRRLFGREPSRKESAFLTEQCLRGKRQTAVSDIVHSSYGIAGALTYMARRWLRLEASDAPRRLLNAAVGQVVASKDLLDGYEIILASDAFFEAAGATNEYFIDYLCRMTTHVFSDRDSRAADLAELKTASRQSFVAKRLRSEAYCRGFLSHWFWFYLGRFNLGNADAEFYWSGAIDPMMHGVPSIGPGYDQSLLLGRPFLIAPREQGRRYRAVWQNVLAMSPRPKMVHVETWNEFFEGSVVCNTHEHGRLYIDMTREFADAFHGYKRWSRAMITEPDIHALRPVLRKTRPA